MPSAYFTTSCPLAVATISGESARRPTIVMRARRETGVVEKEHLRLRALRGVGRRDVRKDIVSVGGVDLLRVDCVS